MKAAPRWPTAGCAAGSEQAELSSLSPGRSPISLTAGWVSPSGAEPHLAPVPESRELLGKQPSQLPRG